MLIRVKMSAGSVVAARPASQQAGSGASPTPALQQLLVRPIPTSIARKLIEREHYLHSLPGGTHLTFGVFHDESLRGAISLGAGPFNAPALVKGATAQDCLTLTRFCLSDELPPNAESRVLGAVLRALKQHTCLKFLLTYADPAKGHVGIIYQATNWLYTGLSEAMPLYDLGDGRLRHSRSLSHAYGTHSMRYFANNGVEVRVVLQSRSTVTFIFWTPPGASGYRSGQGWPPYSLGTSSDLFHQPITL